MVVVPLRMRLLVEDMTLLFKEICDCVSLLGCSECLDFSGEKCSLGVLGKLCL